MWLFLIFAFVGIGSTAAIGAILAGDSTTSLIFALSILLAGTVIAVMAILASFESEAPD